MSNYNIYWFRPAKIIGGPQVRTCRMKSCFGRCSLFKSDIVVGQSWFSPIQLFVYFIASFFKPSVFIQNGFYDNSFSGRIRNQLLKFCALKSSFVVFQSIFCKNKFADLFKCDPSSYKIIYNAVPSSLTARQIEIADLPIHKQKYIFLSGNLRHESRIEEFRKFLDAMIRAGLGQCYSLVVLDDKIEGLNADITNQLDVCFLGKQPNDDAMAITAGASFVVHLKKNDPCPNAVLEALHLQKFVFHHASGGTPELVKLNGIGFTDSSMANDLMRMHERLKMKKFVFTRDTEISWLNFCENYSAVFDALLANR